MASIMVKNNIKYGVRNMKKFAAVCMIALASTMTFVGCGGNDTQVETTQTVEKAPLQDLLNEMIAQNIVVMPMEVDETLAQEAYHIDLNVVDEYAITQTGRTPGPGLIVMVKAKDGQLEQAKANMEALKQDQVGNAFYPAEREAAENAKIIVDGNYVALFILNSEVEPTAIEMFNNSTK